jgi:predicted CXXCH cytochrome family protein
VKAKPMHVLLLTTTLLLAAPQGATPSPPDAEMCLACHSDPQLSMTARDGTLLSMHVDETVFRGSVHASLACADCHAGKTEIPHESLELRSARDLRVTYGEQCRRCHFTTYTKTLDSVHQAAVARGDRMAPVCVDCHGSHDVQRPGQPRMTISDTCARCHQGVATAYAKSIHGRALGTEASGDVPVCTDCHRSHDIGGPHQQKWDLRQADMCGDCHADESRMKKYGLSTAVLRTYLADFHGKTASLRQHQGTDANGRVVARCTDCHGVHDIEKASDPSSPVIKENLLRTCQKCHEDANANFPDAWLSHYEPSLTKAPLVYGVKVLYAVLIPFMIGGLGLQILLHLWRLMVNR